MKTGIIRRIDYLGRIVIPKEIRRKLKLQEDDPMEFSIEGNKVCLELYHPESTENQTDEIKRNNDTLEYKGFKAKIEFSADDKLIVGTVTNADGDCISFHCRSADEIETKFVNCIKDYINMKNIIDTH